LYRAALSDGLTFDRFDPLLRKAALNDFSNFTGFMKYRPDATQLASLFNAISHQRHQYIFISF
jgi:hypothetical protein